MTTTKDTDRGTLGFEVSPLPDNGSKKKGGPMTSKEVVRLVQWWELNREQLATATQVDVAKEAETALGFRVSTWNLSHTIGIHPECAVAHEWSRSKAGVQGRETRVANEEIRDLRAAMEVMQERWNAIADRVDVLADRISALVENRR